MKHLLLSTIFILFLSISTFAQDKPIYQEPLWYGSLSASTLDIISSALIIDGKRIAEGNILLRTEDGKIHWPRALALTAFTHTMEWKTYERSSKWGKIVMIANIIVRGFLGGTRNIYLYYKYVN
jgi:hypothetical protein